MTVRGREWPPCDASSEMKSRATGLASRLMSREAMTPWAEAGRVTVTALGRPFAATWTCRFSRLIFSEESLSALPACGLKTPAVCSVVFPPSTCSGMNGLTTSSSIASFELSHANRA